VNLPRPVFFFDLRGSQDAGSTSCCPFLFDVKDRKKSHWSGAMERLSLQRIERKARNFLCQQEKKLLLVQRFVVTTTRKVPSVTLSMFSPLSPVGAGRNKAVEFVETSRVDIVITTCGPISADLFITHPPLSRLVY
jgi:hypothetical protein